MMTLVPEVGCAWDLDRREVVGPRGRVRLSQREAAVLATLHAAQGEGVARARIAADCDLPDDRAVDFCVRRLRSKLELDPSAPRVVMTVHGQGYRLGLPRAVPPPIPESPRLVLADRSVDLGLGRVHVLGEERSLTTLQHEVLRLLHAADGRPLGREQILLETWNTRNPRMLRRVDAVVAELRVALETHPGRPRHLLTVRGVGYRLATDDRPRTNLAPVPGVALVGRTDALEALLRAVAEHTWVEVVGPPGVGKSVLAEEACRRLASELPGGAWWVDCAVEKTPEGMAAAILRVLGLGGAEPELRVLTALLIRRPPMAVILDNLEQIEGAEDWLRALARTGVRWIGTSTRTLRVGAGQTLELGGLSSESARALYLRLAEQSGAVIRRDEHPSIDAYVDSVDRLPLAIAMAARHARQIPPEELARLRLAELETSSSRGSLSLRTTLDRAWRLATPEQRQILLACRVFRAPFGLAAASAVCGVTARDLWDLVERSFLVALPPVGGVARFRLYGVVRDWLEDRSPPDEAVVTAHAQWFADRARQLADRMVSVLRDVGLERAEFEAASAFLADRAPEAAAGIELLLFLYHRDAGGPQHGVYDTLLDTTPVGSFPWRSKLWLCRWNRDFNDGKTALAGEHLERAVAEGIDPLDWDYRVMRVIHASVVGFVAGMDPGPRPENPEFEVQWASLRGNFEVQRGNISEGLALLESARLLARRRRDPEGERLAERVIAGLLLKTDVPRHRVADRLEALALAWEADGNLLVSGMQLFYAGVARAQGGEIARARRVIERSRRIAIELGRPLHENRANAMLLRIGVADDDAGEILERAVAIAAVARATSDRVAGDWAAFCHCASLARLGQTERAIAFGDEILPTVSDGMATAIRALLSILDSETVRPVPADPEACWLRGLVKVAREARAGRSWYPPKGREDPMVKVAAFLAFGSPPARLARVH